MSEFTQSTVSPFPNQNILFNSASGITGQQIQQNQLGIQQKQLELTDADHEQVARLSAALLNEPDLGKRADLYSRGVGMLQSQNLAKYAPPTLPDESTLRSLVAQAIPAQTQAEWLQNLTANKAYTNAGNPPAAPTAAAPGATPSGGTGPAPFVGANLPAGVTPDEDQLVRTVYGEAGGEPVAGQQAVAHVIKTRMGLGKQGVQDVVFAPNQFEAWSDPKNRPRMEALDPSSPQYQAILNNVVRPVISGQAQDPTGGATNFYNPALQAQLGRSTPGFAQGNQTTIGNHTFFYGGYAPRAATTAAAAPAGGGGAPGPYQVASTAPVPPPGSTAAPAAPTLPPAQTDATQPPAASAPAPTTQPGQPGVRQPPQPPQPPPAAPLPPPPQMPVLTARGLTPQQQAQIDAVASTGRMTVQQRMAAEQAFVTQNVQLRQQAFSDYMQQQQLAVQQGTLSNAQYEARLKAWQAANPVPTTPRFTSSSAVWNPATTQYEPVTPANANLGTPVLGHWGVSNTGQPTFFADSPAAAQRQKEAEAAGTAAGTQTVKQYDALLARAHSAARSEGDIDYAMNQIAQAAKGGQTTGFFSGALATAAAAAKSIGIDTTKLGVDPATVGNIQSAQKTLAVIGGAILRGALGEGSQITDAKIEAFEHTQPGIETDPQALQRIMAWARSQLTYEREMGAAAAAEAGKDENNGVLPPTFIPRYYATHGFAPVYDPTLGEMRQPDGRQPERETPPPQARVPQEGDTATGKDGHKIVLRGGQWVPQ